MDLRRLQADPAAFRSALRIDCDGVSRPLAEVLDPWQLADFEALDSGLRAVVGQRRDSPTTRGWLERPRGHSKTSDLAVSVCWLLFASRRMIKGVAAAADRDQAGFLKSAINRLIKLNPWLAQILAVQQNRVVNVHTDSTLDVIASDAATSYGLLPDFVAVDELTHWKDRGLWDSLLSAAAKRANCLLVCIMNSGFHDSWQYETREAIREDPAWFFSRLDGPVASWITDERLEEQKRLLPHVVYSRLWLNEWSSGSGDALRDDEINRALRLPGPAFEHPGDGWLTYAGLDLGLKRDWSALVITSAHVGYYKETERPQKLTRQQRTLIDVGLAEAPEPEFDIVQEPGTGKTRLLALRIWRPSDHGGTVELASIEQAILDAHTRFNLSRICLDAWQAASLAQTLFARGLPAELVTPGPAYLQHVASRLLEAFQGGRIELFEDDDLLRDLRNLRVEERQYGWRLMSPRTGGDGHGDTVSALTQALYAARDAGRQAPPVANRPLALYP